MIKRRNKITALLIAATSMMSLVPAMASERLGTKDGTINYGIAFDGGKYIYDGYRTDDDDTGIYYNSGDKDKLLEDLEDYEFNYNDYSVKYGTKYALAKDGTNEYLVDLSTGKIADDETDEEKRDSIQSKLRSKLKKTDRYSNTTSFDDVNVEDRLFGSNDQFGDVWYMYTAKGDNTYTSATTDAAVAPSIKISLPTKLSEVYSMAENGTTIKVFGEIISPKTLTVAAGDNLLDAFNHEIQRVVSLAAGATINATYNNDGTITIDKVDTKSTITLVDNKNTTDTSDDIWTGKVSEDIFTRIKNAFATSNDDVKVTVSQGTTNISNGQVIGYTGFVNGDGKYIDASNLANIYAYSNEANKVVKIEEYNDYDKDNQMMVNLDSIKAIAQDKDYIYAITTVNIYQGATEETCNAKVSANARTAYFYQKIAKAQGDKKDDAYIPKTVDSYEIDNKSFYDDGDAKDAYTAILTDDDGYEVENNMYTVKDGTLYVVRVKDDTVKVFKMKTKKVKVDAVDTAAYVADVNKKLDAPLLQKDDDNDHDIFDGAGVNAVSIDVDGNIWALDKGAIYKVDGTDFKEVYTLDRSIDNLDVYNEGSLIAWEGDGDGDVYTTVTEGKADTGTEVPTTKVGWDQLADGSWNFYDANGTKVVSNWANIGGVWYYLNVDGVMTSGWQQINGAWYYLNPISNGTKGAMQTGWLNDNGTWYYLQSSGAMKTGWLNDNGTWYYLQSSGAMKTGWLNDNGTWYYLSGSGAMLSNTTADGYKLNGSGAWVK